MIYCENVVKILWTKHFFFNSSPDFSNHYFIFFPPIFGNAIAIIAKFFFYSPISAMALPQLGSHNFFFSLFRQCHCHNYFATNFFFLPISAMALPQLVCHNFFSPISAMHCHNKFVTIFFFLFRQCHCHN